MTKARSNATAPAAKGQIVVGTGTDASGILGVGANGTVLTADSAEATGLKWAAANAGKNYTLLNSGGTALTGAATITVSGITNIDELVILVQAASSANASATFRIRINSVATNYYYGGFSGFGGSTWAAGNIAGAGTTTGSGILLAAMSASATSLVWGSTRISGCNTTGVKTFQSTAGGTTAGSNGQDVWVIGGAVAESATVSSISIVSDSGNFDNGTIWVWGA